MADSDFPRSDETSKSGTLPGFETKGRCHQKTKQGYQWPLKKDRCPQKILKKLFEPTLAGDEVAVRDPDQTVGRFTGRALVVRGAGIAVTDALCKKQ